MGKSNRRKGTTGITAQNKDVVSKWFGETMKNRSLSVYGVHVPRIVDVRPTNLPAIETNEKRMDISKVRLRIIIIYTADVTRTQTQDMLNVGDVIVSTTEAFLLELASEEVKERIQKKVQEKKALDERDLMELIVLPLTYKGKEKQRSAAQEAVNIAKEIEDEVMQEMALAGILSFSDKIIDKKLANEIRRCLSMTKVGAIIAKEMEESEAKGIVKGRVEGREQEKSLRIKSMLLRQKTPEEIADFCGYDLQEVKDVQENIANHY